MIYLAVAKVWDTSLNFCVVGSNPIFVEIRNSSDGRAKNTSPNRLFSAFGCGVVMGYFTCNDEAGGLSPPWCKPVAQLIRARK